MKGRNARNLPQSLSQLDHSHRHHHRLFAQRASAAAPSPPVNANFAECEYATEEAGRESDGEVLSSFSLAATRRRARARIRPIGMRQRLGFGVVRAAGSPFLFRAVSNAAAPTSSPLHSISHLHALRKLDDDHAAYPRHYILTLQYFKTIANISRRVPLHVVSFSLIPRTSEPGHTPTAFCHANDTATRILRRRIVSKFSIRCASMRAIIPSLRQSPGSLSSSPIKESGYDRIADCVPYPAGRRALTSVFSAKEHRFHC